MTEIQQYQPHSPEAAEAHLNAQMRHAEVLSNSNMLPDKFKGNPANVLMAKEIAQSMGETPWVTMTELYFVGNTPTFSAKYMRTRVRQAGHILRESFDKATGTATCTIIRSDDPDFEHVVTWDKAKAQSHGLWDKGHWKKNPELMMKNRAVSECVREACNEVMGGVNYTPEEAEAMQPVRATSERLDKPARGRGADAVRAALEAKKAKPEPAAEAEKSDAERAKDSILKATSIEDIQKITGWTDVNLDEFEAEEVSHFAQARIEELENNK